MDTLGHSGLADGWTPLCLAARSGDADVAKDLLAAGAKINAVSANGKSALDIATINSMVRKDRCARVLDVLTTEMVASVLEIAFSAIRSYNRCNVDP